MSEARPVTSLLRMSAAARLGLVAGLLLVIWAATIWAIR
jgi:hypothetical protein